MAKPKLLPNLLPVSRELIKKVLLNEFWGKPVIMGLSLAFMSIPFHFGAISIFDLPQNDQQVIQNFIEWFGVPYGLLIALVLVNVWNQFDRIDREFDREADAISMLYETVLLIDDDNQKLTKCKQEITQKIIGYVNHVAKNYSHEHTDSVVRNIGDNFLKGIREVVKQVIHGKEKETVCTELLHQLHEAVDVRGDRISHSSQRMHGTLWVLSFAASVLWVIPFNMLNFENIWMGYVMLFGVTFVVVGLLAVIWDLNDPFGGAWKINIDSWKELKKGLKYQTKKSVIRIKL